MIKFRFRSMYVCLFAVSLFILGCAVHDGSKTVINTAAFPKLIERARKGKRYMIMRSGIDTFTVTSVQVGRRMRQFTVHLAKPDSLHRVRMSNPQSWKEKQTWLYMRDSTSYTLDEPHTIPLDRIARIDLIE